MGRSWSVPFGIIGVLNLVIALGMDGWFSWAYVALAVAWLSLAVVNYTDDDSPRRS